MASRNELQIRLFGLDEVRALEASIPEAQRRFVGELAGDLAAAVGAAAPRGQTGALAASWKGWALSETFGVVESDHPAAKARDRGAYIEAKNGDAVRFRNSFGALVFSRFVRQKGDHYTRRGLAQRRVIAEAAFEREFDHLGKAL